MPVPQSQSINSLPDVQSASLMRMPTVTRDVDLLGFGDVAEAVLLESFRVLLSTGLVPPLDDRHTIVATGGQYTVADTVILPMSPSRSGISVATISTSTRTPGASMCQHRTRLRTAAMTAIATDTFRLKFIGHLLSHAP
jgi:hypothetical protein